MRSKRIQNRIGESRLLLPAAVVAAGALWWLPLRPYDYWDGGGLALCLLCTYLVMEMCNVNSVIRIYSRSVSSTFLLLVAAMGMLHGWHLQLVAAPALAAAMFLLTRVDMVGNAVAQTFHAFVPLGIAVIAVPPLAVVVLAFYWSMAVYLRKFSARAFWAGLIGLLTPLWVGVNMALLTGHWSWVEEWWQGVTDYRLPTFQDYTALPPAVAAAWLLLLTMLVLGLAYYLRNASQDKVRTRMLMYAFATQALLLAVQAAAQPHLAPLLLTAMAVSVSPLTAHYFTLQRTWWGSVMMWLWIVSLASLAVVTCGPWASLYNE